MFNRFDILEAWSLFLDRFSSTYDARRKALRRRFEARPNLTFNGLSENAKHIFLDLLREEMPEKMTTPIVGTGWSCWYHMWVNCGTMQDTSVYVNADSFDDAWDELVDWCDEHCPGAFSGVGEEQIKDAAMLLGFDPNTVWADCLAGQYDDTNVQRVVEQAESGMTMIGHTTLNSWDYTQGNPGIESACWGGRSVWDAAEEMLIDLRVEEDEEEDE